MSANVRVRLVTLGPRGRVPFPVACRLQRIDREHLVPRSDECLNPRAAVGLDSNLYHGLVAILIELLGDHRVQPSHP
jgi:hypothetical protein